MNKKKLNWSIEKKETKNIIESNNKIEEISIKRELIMNYMERFLEDSDIKTNSKKTYFKGLKKFILWTLHIFKEDENIQLSKKILNQYKEHLTSQELNIKPHTQAIYLVSLKQFFVWAESNLLIPNIAKNIKGIKKITKQHHKDPLQQEQIIKLLSPSNNTKKESLLELRNKTLIHILLFTGMRIGESTYITLDDIEIINEEKSIIWIKGKGRTGKDNFVIILTESQELIKNYLSLRKQKGEILNPQSFLFVSHGKKTQNTQLTSDSISKIISKEMKKRNIKTKKNSAHSLRHTFGINAIGAGVSLYDLQISMRHTTSTTTQVYLGDIEKIKRKEGITEEKIWDYIKNKKSK